MAEVVAQLATFLHSLFRDIRHKPGLRVGGVALSLHQVIHSYRV
jgi:hypothetical protein